MKSGQQVIGSPRLRACAGWHRGLHVPELRSGARLCRLARCHIARCWLMLIVRGLAPRASIRVTISVTRPATLITRIVSKSQKSLRCCDPFGCFALSIHRSDCCRRFQPNADNAPIINIGTFGDDSLDDIFGSQDRRHPAGL